MTWMLFENAYTTGEILCSGFAFEKANYFSGLLYDYAQRSIYGNYVGSRRNMMDMLDFSAKHHIESAVKMMPFSRMNEAIEKVRTGAVNISVVLKNQL